MDCNILLTGQRVDLRSINLSDADVLVKWRSDKNIIKYFFNNKPLTLQQHKDWYTNHYLGDNTRIDFIITEKATQRKIGVAGLKNISKDDVEISYAIGEIDMQGKGFAKEALTILIVFAREILHAATVNAHIDYRNVVSEGLITKLGFQLIEQTQKIPNEVIYRLNL